MNPQVDKEEKHLAQNVFCRRLSFALRDYVPYTSHAELWVVVAWFGWEAAFEGNLALVPTHPNLLPWQHGLSSANWIALPKSTSGGHQMGCGCWWGCSVCIAKLQIVQNHQNHCNRGTRMATPWISQHSLLLCKTLPVIIAEEPLPPFFLSSWDKGCGGAEPWSPSSAPFTGLLCTSAIPADSWRKACWEIVHSNHFQRSCFQLGQDTAESFSCRMSYGCV